MLCLQTNFFGTHTTKLLILLRHDATGKSLHRTLQYFSFRGIREATKKTEREFERKNNFIGECHMNDLRTIKRYQNRKLYDTHQSCYVTLEEISQTIREGNEIQVIDNKTKNDITYNTQIQLLFDQERKSLNSGDTELMKRVICSEEGTFTGYIRSLEAKLNGTEEKVADNFQNLLQNRENTGVNTTLN